jgi:hypothetical protein
MLNLIKSKLAIIIITIFLSVSTVAMNKSCDNIMGNWRGDIEMHLYYGDKCVYETSSRLYHNEDKIIVADINIEKLTNNTDCPNYTFDHADVFCYGGWLEIKSNILKMYGPLSFKARRASLRGYVYTKQFGDVKAQLYLSKI